MTQLFRTIVDAFTSFQQPDFNATEKAYTRQFYSIYAQYGNGGLLLTLVLCADVDLDLWKQLVSKVILSDVIDTLMPAIEAMRATLRAGEPFEIQSPPTFTPYQSAVIGDCIDTFTAWLPVTIGATYTYTPSEGE